MNNFSFEIDLANIRTLEYLINVQEVIQFAPIAYVWSYKGVFLFSHFIEKVVPVLKLLSNNG